MRKPTILVTNDDGITAPGIQALVEAMMPLGEIIVVAPDSPQSGMGHAITIGHPLRLHQVKDIMPGVASWQCSGTPVDCVKLARDVVLHRKPDLCVSGINHGSNQSINVIYSGTMSAAMEAAIEGIPSIGFSLLDFDFHADFSLAKKVAFEIANRMLGTSIDPHALLNVNIPKLKPEDCKGIKICRQADAKWEEEFDKRTDPRGDNYYWMTGKFVNRDKGTGTDVEALQQGYVSIVPTQFDLTHYSLKAQLEKDWQFEN